MTLAVAQLVCTDAFAGTERYVATLATALAAVPGQRYAVTVLGGQPEAMTAQFAGTSVRWRPAPTLTAGVRELVRLGRVDLVHAHLTAAEFAAVATRVRHRAPVVSTRHIAKRRGDRVAAQLAGRVAARSIAAQIAVSCYVAGVIEGQSVVILPGSPAAASATVPAAGRPPVVLLAQRLEPEKRTEIALRAWQASGLATEGWWLRIAGDGAERPRLVALADELGVAGSVDWLGYRSDVASLRAQAALLLASCPTESFGLSVVEAMAEGLPVVAVRGAGHDETAGTVVGAAMFGEHDVTEGGRLLRELAHDPARRDALASRAQQVQRADLDSERQIGAVVRLYERLLGERGRTP